MIKINVKVEDIQCHLNKGFIDSYYAFVPIGDMIEWWKYTTNYGYISTYPRYVPELINSYKNLIDKNKIEDQSKIHEEDMYDDDFIVFEFPDEETALYFKLKFCP